KELCSMLESLSVSMDEMIATCSDTGVHLIADLIGNVNPALESCMTAFEMVNEYVKKRERDMKSPLGRFRWVNGAKELEFLRASLADRKLTLNMALAAVSWYVRYFFH